MLSVCMLTLWLALLFELARSGDSTARIWTIPDGPCGTVMHSSPGVHVLKHFKGQTNEKSKDVTTLDWNVSFFFMLQILLCPYVLLPLVWGKPTDQDYHVVWMLFLVMPICTICLLFLLVPHSTYYLPYFLKKTICLQVSSLWHVYLCI
jgi:hypothetical protein